MQMSPPIRASRVLVELALEAATLLEQAQPAQPAAADTAAIDIISMLVHSYHPKWHYEMGKVGYECDYCGAVIRSNADSARASHHREDCVWIRARAWLDAWDKAHPIGKQEAGSDGTI